VLKSEYFTVSEAALLAEVNKVPNYESVFSNTELVAVLAKNYENFGVSVTVR
jgi:hypothetical protein